MKGVRCRRRPEAPWLRLQSLSIPCESNRRAARCGGDVWSCSNASASESDEPATHPSAAESGESRVASRCDVAGNHIVAAMPPWRPTMVRPPPPDESAFESRGPRTLPIAGPNRPDRVAGAGDTPESRSHRAYLCVATLTAAVMCTGAAIVTLRAAARSLWGRAVAAWRRGGVAGGVVAAASSRRRRGGVAAASSRRSLSLVDSHTGQRRSKRFCGRPP